MCEALKILCFAREDYSEKNLLRYHRHTEKVHRYEVRRHGGREKEDKTGDSAGI